MKLFHIIIIVAISSSVITSCRRRNSAMADFPRDPQMARIQILNAFSSTDAAIKAIAFNNKSIEHVLPDHSSSSNGAILKQTKGWSVYLTPEVSAEDKTRLMRYFESLAEAYQELGKVKYPNYPDFDFSFSVMEAQNIVHIVAEGSYGKK